MERDKVWYRRELDSEKCLCGQGKRAKWSFCYRCYRLLPRDMQKGLWQWLGQGYEEAFEAAAKWLEEHVWG